jgi:soluble cytochrome b562
MEAISSCPPTMKNRIKKLRLPTPSTTRTSLLVVLLATGFSLAVFVPLAISAAPARDEQRKESKESAQEEGSEGLEHAMEQMGRSFKRLRASVADKTKNKESLKYVVDLQKATLEAKQLMPPKVEKMEGEQREKAVSEYRGMIVNLLRQELEVEEHLLAGDNAKAAEAIATLNEIQKSGHKEYRERGGGHREGNGPGAATQPAH